MEAAHLIAGAEDGGRLVLDDTDRHALVRRVAEALKASVLAYCVMDTHLHVIAEGPAEHTTRWLAGALHAHTRELNARHGRHGGLLRGPIAAIATSTPAQLARAVSYVHMNPVDARLAGIDRALEYPWSSQRAFSGFCRARFANVPRAVALLEEGRARWIAGVPPALADLDPVRVPCARPELLLGAAAQTFGADPTEVASDARGPDLVMVRAVYVRLGELESYSHSQLGPALGRSRSQIQRFAAVPVADEDVRLARMLLRDPALRRRLARIETASDGQKMPI